MFFLGGDFRTSYKFNKHVLFIGPLQGRYNML